LIEGDLYFEKREPAGPYHARVQRDASCAWLFNLRSRSSLSARASTCAIRAPLRWRRWRFPLKAHTR